MSNSKKDILFIMNNLNCGGAEKALVSLLQTIDYSRYNVDLLLFKQEGLFLNQVPQEVQLLPVPTNYHYFDMSIKKAIIDNFKKLNFNVIINRIRAGFVFKNEKNKAVAEQKLWKYLSKTIKPLSKKYDIAIGFLEKTPNYFCVDKVAATRKIGFIMNDYNKLKMDKTIDDYYFSKLHFIAQDSDESREIMCANFPQYKDKMVVIKSIISASTIYKLAEEKVVDFPDGFTLISVGRLTYQKGYDIAIEALKILFDKKIDFKWVILGDGEEKQQLQQKIKDYNLQTKVVFLGIKENHYPYLKQADIFLHTARFEGFGIVIQEAKILKKPMVLTNFNVAKTHINHNIDGLIADFDPQSIADNLEELIVNSILRNQFSENLSNENYGTENEIENFYKIIEN